MNEETLRDALDTARGNKSEAARRLGCHRDTVSKYVRIYEIDCDEYKPPKQGYPQNEPTSRLGRLSGLLKRPFGGSSDYNPLEDTLAEFDELEEDMIKTLEARGYSLNRNVQPKAGLHEIKVKDIEANVFRVGIVSDTHLCSIHQQITHLHTAYKYFEDNGVRDVLHAGDLCAGNGRVYKGQQYEIFRQGVDQTEEYCIEYYPKREGITTHIISGNHDLSFLQSDGCDILKRISEKREDFNYLGPYSQFLDINGIKFNLHHGGGGMTYARSYKLQKMIEQYSPHIKPNILIYGHLHSTCDLKMYRNVYGMMAGCFEAQSLLLLRMGAYPEVGFTIMTIGYDDDGVVFIEPRWIPFFVHEEADY